MPDKIKSDCPSFLKYWEARAKECRYCKEKFRKEYNLCKKATKKLEEEANRTVEVLPEIEFTKMKGQRMPNMLDWSFAKLREGLPIEDLPKALYNAHMECGKTGYYTNFRVKQIMKEVNNQWEEMKLGIVIPPQPKPKKKKKRNKKKKRRKQHEL